MIVSLVVGFFSVAAVLIGEEKIVVRLGVDGVLRPVIQSYVAGFSDVIGDQLPSFGIQLHELVVYVGKERCLALVLGTMIRIADVVRLKIGAVFA